MLVGKVDQIKKAMSGFTLKPRNSKGAEILSEKILMSRPRIGDESNMNIPI
jgi:hypothetical protein